MKKVLIYTDCFIFGGCEKVLVNLSHSRLADTYQFTLAYRRHELYTSEAQRQYGANFKLIGLPIIDFGTALYRMQKAGLHSSSRRFKYQLVRTLQRSGVAGIYNFLVLWYFFLKQSPDILHLNNGGYPGAKSCLVAAFAGRCAGIKSIILNVNNLAAPRNRPYQRVLDSIILKSVTTFTTASFAAAARLREVLGTNNVPVARIPNTVGPDESRKADPKKLRIDFNVADEEVVIGAVGLLTERKGFHILIRAIADVLRDDRMIRLFVFGDGEMRQDLETLIRDKNLTKYVTLVGHKQNITDYIAGIDFLVAPSLRNEDFPYVVIEAMSLGKPVIGTRVAGIPEQIVDGATGFLVEPGDILDLGKRIKALAESHDLRIQLGRASRERYFENFSFEAIEKAYRDLYENVGNRGQATAHSQLGADQA